MERGGNRGGVAEVDSPVKVKSDQEQDDGLIEKINVQDNSKVYKGRSLAVVFQSIYRKKITIIY